MLRPPATHFLMEAHTTMYQELNLLMGGSSMENGRFLQRTPAIQRLWTCAFVRANGATGSETQIDGQQLVQSFVGSPCESRPM